MLVGDTADFKITAARGSCGQFALRIFSALRWGGAERLGSQCAAPGAVFEAGGFAKVGPQGDRCIHGEPR
ncbi:hypothetical protein [Bradyrhizobium sp. NAS80.1]|uniref:hypothetical protein n=1 Tax=Bradyrhizobium sp. NAS80.1 TaxID=1680159 RepID=UPI0011611EEF|nr:hypothetical protein [Bradyrhizobium sp. NAS80.1]